MLQNITASIQIRSCLKQFHQRLKAALKPRGVHTIGFQAGNFDLPVRSDATMWFATTYPKPEAGRKPRYWNAFGIELKRHGSNSIVVEMNVPVRGINRSVSGLFAQDPTTGDRFLLHRGGVGGGRKGIGRNAFTDWYRAKPVEIDEGNSTFGTALLVTALDGPSFLDDLRYFVESVAQFKKLVAEGGHAAIASAHSQTKPLTFNPEFAGVKKGKRPSNFVAECHHGRVVDALAAQLRQSHSAGSVLIFNNRLIDLGVAKGKKVTAIYEVKTDTSTQSLYTGIGQLMFHSALSSSTPKRTLVLPVNRFGGRESETKFPALQRLGIAVLRYGISGREIRFSTAL
jgi:hypothetical protein